MDIETLQQELSTRGVTMSSHACHGSATHTATLCCSGHESFNAKWSIIVRIGLCGAMALDIVRFDKSDRWSGTIYGEGFDFDDSNTLDRLARAIISR